MYLTPGMLFRTFTLEQRTTGLNSRSRQQPEWTALPDPVNGILTEEQPSERLRWQQMQHPVTHAIAVRGAPQAKEGDRFVLGGRRFYVQAVENPGNLGIWTLYRCEERKDA